MCEVAPLDSRMENKDLRLNVIRDLKAKSVHLVSKRRGSDRVMGRKFKDVEARSLP